MLTHPTARSAAPARPRRHGARLRGTDRQSRAANSATPNGSACCSTANAPIVRIGRLKARLRHARLRQQATIEDVDYRTQRGLDRALFQKLALGGWIEARQNLIIEGPTGVGKSWLACALGHKACRDNHSVLYQRVPRLFADLALAHGDGRYARLMRTLGGVKLLILDDWGLEPPGPQQRRDLLEIAEERHGRGATLITSQLPVDRWHDLIGDPTLADAILDRIVHNAHRIQLRGDSLRKRKAASLRHDERRDTPAEQA